MFRLLCLVVFISFACAQELKNLAGPPLEFILFNLPTPLESADTQNSATYNVDLTPSSNAAETNVLTQTLPLVVDSVAEFSFTFYSPIEEKVTLSLADPSGKHVLMFGRKTFYPIGDLQVTGTDYRFKNPKTGAYILTIKSEPLDQDTFDTLTANTVADAFVVLWNEDTLSTHTALNTYSLITGNQVGLVTRVYNSSTISSADIQSGIAPVALQGSVQNAVMTVMLPSGATMTTPMSDDGLHQDGLANDGIYGALITASAPGQYLFSAAVQGVNANNIQYVRTTQQLATVVDPTLTLLGSAVGTMEDSKTVLSIAIAATAPVGAKYRAYAEVYGIDAQGHSLAVAWVGGMAIAQENAGSVSLSLNLDLNWITLVEASAPLTLQNVVFQDPESFVPVAQAASIPVKTDFNLNDFIESVSELLIGKDGAITPEMLEGKMPESLKANTNATDAATAAIILVHGYCSEKNPFTTHAADWTNAHFYLNSKQNLPHDTFANNVINWAKSFGAYSYVAHSQGGAVGLHMKNYYWTGLDLVTGGRVLQSVGTPYQGCGGAGTAADLVKIFGVSCGANQDLTKDGSKLWLTGITPANRGLVNYYTTTYVQGKFLGDYCNLATNLVLKWPNDGVAEYDLTQLPGAVNQGNTEGWCHSVGMKYDPQCENRDRNKKMNAAAARELKA